MRRRRGIIGLNGGAGIPVITATATGNPLTFETDMARPLKSLVIPFTPIQAAGTPSPDNPLPISGWTGCEITQTPEDLIELASRSITNGDVTINIGSSSISVTGMSQGNLIYKLCAGNTKTYPAGTYTIYCDNPDIYVNTLASESNFRSNVAVKTAVEAFILDNVRMMIRKNIAYDGTPFHVYLFEGSNVIPTTLPINWQTEAGTVYGGTLTLNEDGSADLVADQEYKRYTGENSEGWRYSSRTHQNNAVFYSNVQVRGAKYTERNYNYIKNCNMLPIITYDELNNQDIAGITITGGSTGFPSIGIPKSVLSTVDVVGLTSYLSANPLDIIYELATPITYHFDNVGQLTAFLGTNNIWTDTNGTNTATYLKHQS